MIKKKILFRVDAGASIGLGHFYRSINLATALKTKGHTIIFTFRDSEFWSERLKEGFPFQSFILGDAEETSETEFDIIKAHQIDLLYVDGFINYPESLIDQIKGHGVRVVFYQNLTEAKKYADVFILPSIHQDELFFSEFSPDTLIYAGIRYFTFSKAISALERKSPPESLKSIGIIAGGSDPKNTLLRLYKMLDQSKLPSKVNITFYYGVNYIYKSEIENLSNENCTWEPFNYSHILANDLLVSAFGVSTYEFMALGMPVVSFGHQLQNATSANYLAENTQSLISMGNIDDITILKLEETLGPLLANPSILKEMVSRAEKLIDLKGIERVVALLETLK